MIYADIALGVAVSTIFSIQAAAFKCVSFFHGLSWKRVRTAQQQQPILLVIITTMFSDHLQQLRKLHAMVPNFGLDPYNHRIFWRLVVAVYVFLLNK